MGLLEFSCMFLDRLKPNAHTIYVNLEVIILIYTWKVLFTSIFNYRIC